MRSVDFRTLLERCPAEIALFSTYAFQPIYFERSLLNSRALEKARRIVVLMDGWQYRELQKEGEITRHLNHRYLVVPIFRKSGVFHPKLHLLAANNGAMVFCGSSNLTQAGCTHNLEILNAVQMEVNEGQQPPPTVTLAHQTVRFFEQILSDIDRQDAKLAINWLEELKTEIPWLQPTNRQRKIDGNLHLVHSVSSPLWSNVLEHIGNETVEHVDVLSPFYDDELAVLKNMQKAWPTSDFRIVAQQHTSNVPTKTLSKLSPSPELLALTGQQERRLHAKLFSIETSTRTCVVTGSANFTKEAWDSTNVEACFIWDTEEAVGDKLLNDTLKLVPITPQDFAPGTETPPSPETKFQAGRIYLNEAILESAGKIRIDYGMDTQITGSEVYLRLYPAGEMDPLPLVSVPAKYRGQETLIIPEKDRAKMRFAVGCELTAIFSGARITSHRTWLIQENALTYVPGEGDQHTKTEREVIETGRGLTYLLGEIEEEDGFDGLVRWLREHEIRFSNQPRQFFGRQRGIPRKRDPFRSDNPSEEALETPSEEGQRMVQKAIEEFVEKHQKQKLKRHISKGNIYGLRNYMDIFIAVNSMVFEYYVRGLIKAPMTVGLLKKNFDMTLGIKRWRDKEGTYHKEMGYLPTLKRNYQGDMELLQERLGEANIPGHLYVSLMVIRIARNCYYDQHAESMLRKCYQQVISMLEALDMALPSIEEQRRALREYEFISTSCEEQLLVEMQAGMG